jgi:hypothetical protein
MLCQSRTTQVSLSSSEMSAVLDNCMKDKTKEHDWFVKEVGTGQKAK